MPQRREADSLDGTDVAARESKPRPTARFGTLAAAVFGFTLLLLAYAVFVPYTAQFFPPRWAVLFSVVALPSVVIIGIIGIIFDANKWPAIVVTLAVPVFLASC